jgi:hypothetical protein
MFVLREERNMQEQIDVAQLAREARELGYTSKDLVINRLMRILVRNQGYVKRRVAQGRGTLSHTETTAEDSLVIALAIQMLQEERP